jgi:hypothetical protein
MKIAKRRIRELIMEEIGLLIVESEEYLDNAYAPTEDNQEPIVAANDALHEALEALGAPGIPGPRLVEALEALESITKFNMDSRITLADLDYKIVKINRAIAKLDGAVANINRTWKRIQG